MIPRRRQLLPMVVLLAAAVGLCGAVAVHAGQVGKTRIYYVAADEVEWDYAPSGRDEAMGMPFDSIARQFTESGPHQIGRVYKKAIYREYTDATFSKVKPRDSADAYLGLFGPIMYAEVGDTIKAAYGRYRGNVSADGDGGHGAGESRHLAVSLPYQRPHAGRHGGAL